MNRRIFYQLSGPAAVVGFLLFGASLASVWSIQRLQSNLASILSDNVASVEAAQNLVLYVRRLRFDTLLQMMDPQPLFQESINRDRDELEAALQMAKDNCTSDREAELVAEIEARYTAFRKDLDLSKRPESNDVREYVKWVKEHRTMPILEPCFELARHNKDMMEQTARESDSVARQTRLAVLVLGILGPISGLIVGYVISRAWSRSIAQLNVRLQDVHASLDRDVADVQLDIGSDLDALDRQLDRVVVRVKEVAEQLHRQQQDILRSEQLAAVGQLAASVAHEIRNPLTAIKMLIGAALRPVGAQDLTREDLVVIYDEVGKQEAAVQALLDYAKPEELHRRQADLRTVLVQAANLVRSRAQHQQVRVDLNLPDTEAVGRFDPKQMGIVFVNLLMNSLDAMPVGGSITIGLDRPKPGTFTVTVADDGPGVPADVVPRIFDPFASTKATGTGLGLSICQRIVREHGGTITYVENPKGGASFVVSLPIASEEPAHAALTGRR